MTDKPILFSGLMVRALLEGRKTQTRRILGTRGRCNIFSPDLGWADSYVLDPGNAEWRARDTPYSIGDRLWVKETWGTIKARDHLAPRQLIPSESTIGYATDDISKWCQTGCNGAAGKWRPSIFMPRWASRLTLIITDVRVQRLRDISEDDAEAEGVLDTEFYDNAEHKVSAGAPFSAGRLAFADLWNSLNGKRPGCSWSDNPWVAALTFEVHQKNVDQMEPDNG